MKKLLPILVTCIMYVGSMQAAAKRDAERHMRSSAFRRVGKQTATASTHSARVPASGISATERATAELALLMLVAPNPRPRATPSPSSVTDANGNLMAPKAQRKVYASTLAATALSVVAQARTQPTPSPTAELGAGAGAPVVPPLDLHKIRVEF